MTKNGDILHQYEPVEFEQLRATIAAKPRPRRRTDIRWIRHHPKIAAVLVTLLIMAVPVSAYTLLSQTIPAVPATGVIIECSPLTSSKASVLLYSSGFVLMTCPSLAPAIQALAQTHATANYTLPAPYVSAYIYPSGQESNIVTTCTDAPAALSVANPIIFGYSGGWSYGLNYTNAQATGLPSFAVNWTVS